MGAEEDNRDHGFETKSPQRGDLVRWVSDYNIFGADDRGNVFPSDPVYEYGIIMDVSDVDPWAVVIYGTSVGFWFTAQILNDDIEILSRAKRRIIIPTPAEVKKYER